MITTYSSASFHYGIYLSIYQPSKGKIEELFKVIRIGGSVTGVAYFIRNNVKDKIEEIKSKLISDNPILVAYNFNKLQITDSFYRTKISDFDKLIDLTNIKRTFKDVNIDNFNPEENLNLFDIIWVTRNDKFSSLQYHHVGVYLGNGWLANIATYKYKEKDQDKKDKETKISSFKDFLKESNELIVYTPFIPYKKLEIAYKQIKTVVEIEYRKDEYSLISRNCEHLANMLIYGVNKSHQVDKIFNRAIGGAEIAARVITVAALIATNNTSSSPGNLPTTLYNHPFSLKKEIKKTNKIFEDLILKSQKESEQICLEELSFIS